MVYLLRGGNSYRALKKISEIRSAFYKKGGDGIAVVEIDGADTSYKTILELVGTGNLFAKKRLVICKNIIESHPQFAEMMSGEGLLAPTDVFVFWERDLPDDHEAYAIFKKIATKIEETALRSSPELDRWLQKEASTRGIALSPYERSTLLETAQIQSGEAVEYMLEAELEKLMLSEKTGVRTQDIAYSKQPAKIFSKDDKKVFSHVDKVYHNDFSRALIAHRRSQDDGVIDMDLLSKIMWKLKNIFLVGHGEANNLNPYVAQKARSESQWFDEKNIFDAFWSGIMADSSLKWDNKNANDHFDRYLLKLKNK